MSVDNNAPDQDIKNTKIRQEAYFWVTEMSSGGMNKDFEEWLAVDPCHGVEYERLQSLLQDFDHMNELAALEPLDDLTLQEKFITFLTRGRPSNLSWRFPVVTVSSIMAVIICYFTVIGLQDQNPVSYDTKIAEIQNITLEDGTKITLGARSSIDVKFTKSARHITLLSGEAYFSVTKDKNRPFFVKADDTLVRVVGTRFDIHKGLTSVKVAVLEGVVEVRQPENNSPVHVLKGGDKVASTAKGIEVLNDNGSLGAWRNGRFIYVDAALMDVLSDVNRYYKTRIEFSRIDLQGLRVTAAFRTDQIDVMLDSLRVGLPIEIIKTGPEKMLLRRKKSL